jgi:hypothetical protein
MRHGIARGASITAAVLAAAACSSGTSATPAGSTATTTAQASPAAIAGPARPGTAKTRQPETAAGAIAVARQYFDLYSASQFAASWELLAPSARRAVSRATWVAVHEGCPPQSGLAYDVKTASLTGRTAVVRLSVKGDAGIVVSEALTYSAGHWGFVPDDLSLFENGSVKADIAAAKAEGFCGAS